MKKFLLLLIMLQVSNSFAQNQKGTIEINSSYGFISAPRVSNYASNILGSVGTLGNYDVCDHENSGPVSVHPKYYISDRIKLGLNITFEQEKEKTMDNGLSTGKVKSSYYCFMPSVTYNYWQRDNCEVYGCVSLGAGIENSTFSPVSKETYSEKLENSIKFACQFSALGIRYGKKVGIFMELGYGYNGIFQAGISYNLH
jgi:hypothetical protein